MNLDFYFYFFTKTFVNILSKFFELQDIISEFEKLSGVTVLKRWDSAVTHIIASTDENGACKRTLKILMGILEGKWILNINC